MSSSFWDPYDFTDETEDSNADGGGGDSENSPKPAVTGPDEGNEKGEQDEGDPLAEEEADDGAQAENSSKTLNDEAQLLARLQDALVSGDTFERKGAARSVLEVFRQLYFADADLTGVIAVIDTLVEDGEQSVRTEIVEQLPHLALFCHDESPRLDHVVPNHILPHIVLLLTDYFTQVRQSAQSGLMFLLERGIIGSAQVADTVLPVVLDYTRMAQADRRAEMTMFLVKLAPLTGKEITVNSFLEMFCYFCEDSMFQVRRACAMGMGDIASVVGTRLTEEVLLPKFLTLCKDTVWGVRKGCAEVYTVVATMSQLVTRKKVLAPAFVTLLNDSSRWVRISAYQTLGSFIATFAVEDSTTCTQESSEIDQTFIDKYVAHQDEWPSQDPSGNVASDSDEDNAQTNDSVDETRIQIDASVIDNMLSNRIANTSGELDNDTKLDGIVGSASESMASVVMVAQELAEEADQREELSHARDEFEEPSIDDIDVANAIDNLKHISVPQQQISIDSAIDSPSGVENLIEILSSTEKHVPSETAANESCENLGKSEDDGLGVELTDDLEIGEKTELEAQGSVTVLNVQSVKDAVSNLTIEEDTVEQVKVETSNNEAATSCEPMETDIEPGQEIMDVFAEEDGGEGDTVTGEGPDFRPRLRFSSRDFRRSYTNLYKATKDLNGAEDPYLSLGGKFRMFEAYHGMPDFSEEGDPDSLSSEYFRLDTGCWRASGSQPRLLEDIPKPLSPRQQDVVPVDLLQHYISMCESARNPAMDSALISFCVFNFPAVVLTLGPQNWSIVRECFESIACNMQWKVRYTLACSLHEIAQVIGPELAERDLLPFFYQLVKDVDEVRIGVLRNLYDFVQVLGVSERKKCLETFGRFLVTDNKRNWRFRIKLGQQVQLLAGLYSPEDVYAYLKPVALRLVEDAVAEVRKLALSVIAVLIKKISTANATSGEKLIKNFVTELVSFLCHSSKWSRRQAFATLAGCVIKISALSQHHFEEVMLPHLLAMRGDPVPNVRLTVAASLVVFSRAADITGKEVTSVLEQLEEDDDVDVAHSAILITEFECLN